MRKLRDIFYVKSYPEQSRADMYGMELHEFIKCAPIELKQLMLLKTGYLPAEHDAHTGFEIVTEAGMTRFKKENISHYGNFCWVDFDDLEGVQKLTMQEVAELLYLEHSFEPLNSPFFDAITNRYAYVSHDDGWLLKLYLRQNQDLKEIIANKITSMLSMLDRVKLSPFPEEIKEKLAKLAEEGLLIDFPNTSRLNGKLCIFLYSIGEFTNMDTMYNEHTKYIHQLNNCAYLVQKNKTWSLFFESKLE